MMTSVPGKELDIRITENNTDATIHLSGNFVLYAHRAFRTAYAQLLANSVIASLTIDLAQIEHLDSAGLGMLLLLRDRVQDCGKSLILAKPSPIVERAFELANFDRLFTIQ